MRQVTIDRIRKLITDRGWEQYHTPANLAKSISIEAGELLECFQWSDTEYDIEHVKEALRNMTGWMIIKIWNSVGERREERAYVPISYFFR